MKMTAWWDTNPQHLEKEKIKEIRFQRVLNKRRWQRNKLVPSKPIETVDSGCHEGIHLILLWKARHDSEGGL